MHVNQIVTAILMTVPEEAGRESQTCKKLKLKSSLKSYTYPSLNKAICSRKICVTRDKSKNIFQRQKQCID